MNQDIPLVKSKKKEKVEVADDLNKPSADEEEEEKAERDQVLAVNMTKVTI